jgi:transmembrane sensor
MKYNQYDIEDFLADKEFIHWVKKRNGDQSFFFENWLGSNPPNKEKALLARELLVSLQPKHLEGSKSEFDEVLENLMKYNHHSKNQYIKHQPVIWLRWAAIILLAFSFTFILNPYKSPETTVLEAKKITKENPSGQRSQIQLPDGSMVHLNAESKITYTDDFGIQSRELDLLGEAFFEVRGNADLPFIVKTGEIYAKALGTSFNVMAHCPKEVVDVTLITGSVEVGRLDNGEFPKTTLNPGEKAELSLTEIRKTKYDYSDIAWKDGIIVFEKATLQQVTQKLQRWYGVAIKVENAPIDTWSYTGKFQNTSLEIILERMSYSQKFKYDIYNDFVNIKF